MAEDDEPIKGIDRSGRGYFGVSVAPDRLAAPVDPRRDPWLAWAAAVEHAKRGNFEPVSRVMGLYDRAGDYTLNFMCVIVVGDAGPARCFPPIAADLERRATPDEYETALDLAYALSIRGRLGDVPLLLRTYERLAEIEDADIMHVYLSYMLARGPGELLDPGEFASMDEYAKPVRARYGELVQSVGPDALVFGGEQFGVVRLAHRILDDLQTPYFLPDLRRRFEACTGIDCSAFFRKGVLQPLAAAAVVEDFLNGPQAARYRDGVRYFFGRPIPD